MFSSQNSQVSSAANYIEDVFSTYLYTGNAGTQTVTNGIDLSTKGGMVWIKSRSGAYSHSILDTVRGFNYSSTQTKRLDPSTTDSQADAAGNATQATPLSDGFSVTTSGGGAINFYNASGATYASWTFRKQAKFFDVVTYTGNGAGPQVINHNLGSAPGCVIVKSTSNTSVWWVWHRGNGGSTDLTGIELNSTSASTFQNAGVASDFTATTFNAGSLINVALNLNPNVNGQTYVAYLFAHNAGGFGLTGTDNVISCGSYSGTGSPVTVDLGFEPQWIMFKSATSADNWRINDVMRGIPTGGADANLAADLTNAEYGTDNRVDVTSTGFIANASNSQSGVTHIYIAIRRGPMKVPTSGTSVFDVDLAGNSSAPTMTSAFPVDLGFITRRNGGDDWYWVDRLRGGYSLNSNSAAIEASFPTLGKFDYMNGYGSSTTLTAYTGWNFRRAPSFFDEVCYTGINGAQTVNHNLGVAPELMFIKSRGTGNDWAVYSAARGTSKYLTLDTSDAETSFSIWNGTTPTATAFYLGGYAITNNGGTNYVAYLFATCAGVSKVGSYTGTGTTKQIDCGFTGGARFVLIKRTDSTGDWYVWDSARGIVSGNDPYMLLNNQNAEVTNTDYVDTYSAGFEISSTAPAAINASGGTFIFLAIA